MPGSFRPQVSLALAEQRASDWQLSFCLSLPADGPRRLSAALQDAGARLDGRDGLRRAYAIWWGADDCTQIRRAADEVAEVCSSLGATVLAIDLDSATRGTIVRTIIIFHAP